MGWWTPTVCVGALDLEDMFEALKVVQSHQSISEWCENNVYNYDI